MPVMASWEVLSGRVSNFYMDQDSLYYLADQDCLRCFDRNLDVKWSAALPEDITTRSYIHQYGDTMVMINLATAYKGGADATDIGRPFVAAFNRKDGAQLYYRELSTRSEMVLRLKFLQDRLFLSYADSCQLFSLNDQSLRSFAWDKKEYGKIFNLTNGVDYCHLDEETHQFVMLDSLQNYVVSDQDGLYQLGAEAPVKIATSSLLYAIFKGLPEGRKLLIGGPGLEDCWIINADGTPYCHFDVPVHSVRRFPHHFLLILNDGRSLLLDR